MHKLILASGAGSSLVVTITIIVDSSAQVGAHCPVTGSTADNGMYCDRGHTAVCPLSVVTVLNKRRAS